MRWGSMIRASRSSQAPQPSCSYKNLTNQVQDQHTLQIGKLGRELLKTVKDLRLRFVLLERTIATMKRTRVTKSITIRRAACVSVRKAKHLPIRRMCAPKQTVKIRNPNVFKFFTSQVYKHTKDVW